MKSFKIKNKNLFSKSFNMFPQTYFNQFREYKVPAEELKKGDILDFSHSGKLVLMEVVGYNFNKQARSRNIMTVELKDILKNTKIEKKVRPTEEMELAEVEEGTFLIKSADKENFTVEDTKESTEKQIPRKLFEPLDVYLNEGDNVGCTFYEDQAVKIKFPLRVICKVKSVQLRAQDSSGSAKTDATLTNGRKIKVPLHIKEGESIQVKLPEEEYQPLQK
eukprot:TRINITY_DN9633_c0_g1_i1.p1 TRINITY_DN9633_c0_g1~~TRINITY_DN9633_c0_g1_i1.p1  ORF type:complete len:220 (-),score=60.43 TRINITY_DN9633_c0_g1_i1:17-676(-)